MAEMIESMNLGDLLKYEAPHFYSRDRVTELEEALAACVGLVAQHHGRPLGIAHGRCPRVGEQVDVHVFGPDVEHVVACFADAVDTLFYRGHLDGFDNLDAVRFCVRLPRPQ